MRIHPAAVSNSGLSAREPPIKPPWRRPAHFPCMNCLTHDTCQAMCVLLLSNVHVNVHSKQWRCAAQTEVTSSVQSVGGGPAGDALCLGGEDWQIHAWDGRAAVRRRNQSAVESVGLPAFSRRPSVASTPSSRDSCKNRAIPCRLSMPTTSARSITSTCWTSCSSISSMA